MLPSYRNNSLIQICTNQLTGFYMRATLAVVNNVVLATDYFSKFWQCRNHLSYLSLSKIKKKKNCWEIKKFSIEKQNQGLKILFLTWKYYTVLTLSWRRSLSYRNQSIDLQSKSMDWFLYDHGLRHESVKSFQTAAITFLGIQDFLIYLVKYSWLLLNFPNLITQQCFAKAL